MISKLVSLYFSMHIVDLLALRFLSIDGPDLIDSLACIYVGPLPPLITQRTV